MNLIKLFFLAIILAPSIAVALSSDRQKPIETVSNTASLDSEKGITIYEGAVVVTQGTTEITGDMITIYNNKEREVTKIVAVGKRAKYQEQQEDNKGILKAWGETINYDVLAKHIVLLNNAELTRPGELFKGEKIDYDTEKKNVVATSKVINSDPKTKVSGSESKSRVRMIIQPQDKSKDTSKDRSKDTSKDKREEKPTTSTVEEPPTKRKVNNRGPG